MCGIVGYLVTAGQPPSDIDRELAHARDSLRYRGPDDRGIWTNSTGVGLGHTRLSILDLSNSSHQPMLSEDKQLVIVFNGEIYNFRKIRSELETLGHRFYSQGDTEVILASFRQWGVGCVNHFIGMFAFAIWDDHHQEIHLFRDRVGVKPLYYGWDGQIFWFGSELKALCEFHHWTPAINKQALGEFFQYGSIAAPRSIYRQVNKLSPGHWLRKGLDTAPPELHQYWAVENTLNNSLHAKSEEELASELEEILIEAINHRMVADVPIGVFLSGGIDSTLVASILQKNSTEKIRTFTVGFKDGKSDESAWAKRIADHIGSDHTEYILEEHKAQEVFSRISTLFDEPFGDSSSVPTSVVSSLASKKVKVVLSADGGDELFCGYPGYIHNRQKLERCLQIPKALRELLGSAPLRQFVQQGANWCSLSRIEWINRKQPIFTRLYRFLQLLGNITQSTISKDSQTHWDPEEVSQLIGEEYFDPRRPVEEFPGSYEEQMALWDFSYYLPDDILVKVDRATMHESIEGREPLLDHRLIEFAFNLPLKFRIGELGLKHLLRKVLYKYVPRELVDRPKQGFSMPVERWIHAEPTLDELQEENSMLGNYLNTGTVQRELKMLGSCGGNESRVWLLLVFNQWLKTIANKDPE